MFYHIGSLMFTFVETFTNIKRRHSKACYLFGVQKLHLGASTEAVCTHVLFFPPTGKASESENKALVTAIHKLKEALKVETEKLKGLKQQLVNVQERQNMEKQVCCSVVFMLLSMGTHGHYACKEELRDFD